MSRAVVGAGSHLVNAFFSCHEISRCNLKETIVYKEQLYFTYILHVMYIHISVHFIYI